MPIYKAYIRCVSFLYSQSDDMLPKSDEMLPQSSTNAMKTVTEPLPISAISRPTILPLTTVKTMSNTITPPLSNASLLQSTPFQNNSQTNYKLTEGEDGSIYISF